MTEHPVYIGKDLEAMSFAFNYHCWILDEFRPFMGENVVEVGAGTGSFSELLLSDDPQKLTLIEPSEMYEHLETRISSTTYSTEITLYNSIFINVADEIAAQSRPDTVIYINVLEHIEDDIRELQLIHRTLSRGGHCLVFVPALQSLYGKFDREVGHFRRYSKKEIEDKCRSVGFEIVLSKYFDFPGILPWFVKYRILRSSSLGSSAVTLYDRIAVPIARRFESLINVPLGKNILLVGKKQ